MSNSKETTVAYLSSLRKKLLEEQQSVEFILEATNPAHVVAYHSEILSKIEAVDKVLETLDTFKIDNDWIAPQSVIEGLSFSHTSKQ